MELEIIPLVLEGLNGREAALSVGTSVKTVEALNGPEHRKNPSPGRLATGADVAAAGAGMRNVTFSF